ncbi:MAG: hypothetical protein JXB13_00510, partial [Phycisphaerae bacterium]|nr:hypothetical protein [Phycisphaerae bacterium]
MKKNTKPNAKNTTQRDWHDLKPGDVIWFATGWFEVFDAYAVGRDMGFGWNLQLDQDGVLGDRVGVEDLEPAGGEANHVAGLECVPVALGGGGVI